MLYILMNKNRPLCKISIDTEEHFLIEKNARGNSVKTHIERLDDDASIREIARILGGAKVTDSILKSAREMKELAKSER